KELQSQVSSGRADKMAQIGEHDGLWFMAAKINLEPNDAIQNGYLVLALNNARSSHVINRSIALMAGLLLAGAIASILLGYFLSGSIAKSLSHSIESLGSASRQVASASTQLSLSSKGLAEGASVQETSIQQSSSAMQEMAAMTQQNAEN